MPRRDAVLVYETQRGRLTSRQLALAAEVDPAQLSSNKDRALKKCRTQMAMTWVAGSMRLTEGNDGGCPELTARLRAWSPPRLAGTAHYRSVHRHVLGFPRAGLEPCGLCLPVYEEFRTNGTEHILSKFRALPLAAGPEGVRHWLRRQSGAEDTGHRRGPAGDALGRRPRTPVADPAPAAKAMAREALTLGGAPSGGLPAPAGNAAGPTASAGPTGASAAVRPRRHLVSGAGNRLLVPVQNAVARTHLAFTSGDLSAAQQGARAAAVVLTALVAALPLLSGDAPGHGDGHRHAAGGTVSAAAQPAVVPADFPPTVDPAPATGRPSTAPPVPGVRTTPGPPAESASPAAPLPPPSPSAPPTPSTSRRPAPTRPADRTSDGHSPTTSAPGTGTGTGTPPPPSHRYTSAPDMTGHYGVEFTRTNYGNGAEGVPQPFTITLHRLSDASCPATTPCYQGIWLNTGANNREEGTFTASVTVSGDRLHLTGTTPPDYPYNGVQYYDATAPNDNRQALSFSGTFSQASRDDGERAATFTLTRE